MAIGDMVFYKTMKYQKWTPKRTFTADDVMQHMNEAARAAMKQSAVESLAAALLGIKEIKQNAEQAKKLAYVRAFMIQLQTYADRKTNSPDWGEW